MKSQCASCRQPFEAQRSTARFCSPRCRQRARRAAQAAAAEKIAKATGRKPPTKKAVVSERAAVGTPADSTATHEAGLVVSVRRELEEHRKLDTFAGQLALQLARRMADPDESGISSLSKELRTVMAAAVGETSAPADSTSAAPASDGDLPPDLAEARRKRDAAREAAGRA